MPASDINPIRLEDIINLSGSEQIKKVADLIEQLTKQFEQFNQVVVSSPMERFIAQQVELSKSMKGIADSIMNANQNTRDGINAINTYTGAMQNMKVAADSVIGSKRKMQQVDLEIKAQYDVLNKTLNNATSALARMKAQGDESIGTQRAYNKIIQDTIGEIKKLDSSLKSQTETVVAANNSNKLLKETLLALRGEYDLLSTEEKKTSLNAKELLDTIQILTLRLKEETITMSGANTEMAALNAVSGQLTQTEQKLNVILDESNGILKQKIELTAFQQDLNKRVAQGVLQYTGEAEVIERAALEKKGERLAAFREREIEGLSQQSIQFQANAKRQEDVYASMWLKNELTQEAAINRMLLEQQKLLDETEASEDKMRINVFKNEAAKVEAREAANRKAIKGTRVVAEENEIASNKSAWSWANFVNIFDRMGLRMIASMFWWGLVIGGATALWEWWTKIDDATKSATDRLKDYYDGFKDLQKNVLAAKPQAQADIIIDQEKAQRILSDMQRELVSGNKQKAYNKYVELQSEIGKKVLDDVYKEDFMRKGLTDRMKEQISVLTDKYIPALKEQAKAQEINNQATLEMTKNMLLQDEVKKEIADKIRKDPDYAGRIFSPGRFNAPVSSMIKDGATDDQLIALAQKNVTRVAEEKSVLARNFGLNDLKENIRILNSLNQSQTQVMNQRDYSKAQLDKLQSTLTDLEGNTKDPKGSHPKGKNRMDEELRLQENTYKDNIGAIKGKYDENNPYNTYEDDDELSRNKIKEAEDNAKKKLSIIEKYHNSKYEDDTRYLSLKKATTAEEKSEDNKMNENENRISMERKRRYQDAEKQIEEYHQRLKEANLSLYKATEEYRSKRTQAANTLKDAKKVNPFLSAFGIDDQYAEFQKNQENLQTEINAKSGEIKEGSANVSSLQIQKLNKDKQVETLGEGVKGDTEQEKYPNDKLGDYKTAVDEKRKIDIDLIKSTEKLTNDANKKSELEEQKKLNDTEKKTQLKKDLIQKSFQFAEQIANQAFNNEKLRLQQQMQALQENTQLEMSLAGNNSSAKQKIAIEEHNKMIALRRKEAEIDKEQAIFSALISTAAGIAKVIGEYGLPLGAPLVAITAAAGALQVGAIASRPLPSYWKGRNGGTDEIARINEKGAEIVESDETYKIFGGGKETVTHLNAGDIVHTHEESKDLIFGNDSDKFIRDLLNGTGAYVQKEEDERKEMYEFMVQAMVSKEDFQIAMEVAISKMPPPTIVIKQPAKDVEDRHIRQQLRNGL